jgi:hypothetical protein
VQCNYGVPLIDFDSLFGTYVEYEDYTRVNRRFDRVKQFAALRRQGKSEEEAAAIVAGGDSAATEGKGAGAAPVSSGGGARRRAGKA